jgi:hypothetical protein
VNIGIHHPSDVPGPRCLECRDTGYVVQQTGPDSFDEEPCERCGEFERRMALPFEREDEDRD